ncbi:hypothetical protein CBR_g66812 [Chara braunii]|uniref:Uncharacterized protein n=1 Tax=Chara braunii TaxID=69332 RepID=A0A388K9H1_CHABU|nr:hypothetical protein CBR_g66812 [Chara braunii]|eukprot:GBG66677.1 hypothetical protein CBR_g66812 [Chara braunii]
MKIRHDAEIEKEKNRAAEEEKAKKEKEYEQRRQQEKKNQDDFRKELTDSVQQQLADVVELVQGKNQGAKTDEEVEALKKEIERLNNCKSTASTSKAQLHENNDGLIAKMFAEQERMKLLLEDALTSKKRLELIEQEMKNVKATIDEARAEADRWQEEALRPGNKQGCVAHNTPVPRTSTRPQANTPGPTPAVADYKNMMEMHRMEVEAVKEMRASEVNARKEAEQELDIVKAKVQALEREKGKAQATPRSLRARMEEAAVDRSTEKNTPAGSTSKSLEKETSIHDNRSLKILTKDGLTAIREKEGVKYVGVKQTVEDIIKHRVEAAFPTARPAVVNVSEDLVGDKGAGDDTSTS